MIERMNPQNPGVPGLLFQMVHQANGHNPFLRSHAVPSLWFLQFYCTPEGEGNKGFFPQNSRGVFSLRGKLPFLSLLTGLIELRVDFSGGQHLLRPQLQGFNRNRNTLKLLLDSNKI